MSQTHLADILVRRARRCYDLTAAVPAEHEASLWEQGDLLVAQAASFGDPECERWLADERSRKLELAQQILFW